MREPPEQLHELQGVGQGRRRRRGLRQVGHIF
jgi:hypothetical protein